MFASNVLQELGDLRATEGEVSEFTVEINDMILIAAKREGFTGLFLSEASNAKTINTMLELSGVGYCCECCSSVDTAIEHIKTYLGIAATQPVA